MKVLYYLILTLLVVPGYLRSQTDEEVSSRLQMIHTFLDQQVPLSGYFIVGYKGKVIFEKGYGMADREKQVPFDQNTLYSIGSITKPVTATAILQLFEAGKLIPEDPLAKFFDDVPQDKKNITLHQLLTHTSGLVPFVGDDYAEVRDVAFRDLVWESTLLSAPGTRYEYSNVGYSLLGMIIEKVSGMSYEDYLIRHVFEPCGMKTAGYTRSGVDYTKTAHGYFADGTDWGTARDKKWDGSAPYWNLKANGGLLVSARDMFQWYQGLRQYTLLRPETIALQMKNHVREAEGAPYFYGYGYSVTEEGDVVQHNGGNRIFKADFRWFPKEDFFIFSVTNDASVRLFMINDQVLDIWHDGKLPDVVNWNIVDMSAFPQDEDQHVAALFIRVLKSMHETDIHNFISEHCTEGMLERNGKTRLKEVFGMLQGDIGSFAPLRVETSGESIRMSFPAKEENVIVRIRLFYLDGKIDRLGAELEGM